MKQFLDKYAYKMPRVMLRYSVEKLDEKEKKYYYNKNKWKNMLKNYLLLL